MNLLLDNFHLLTQNPSNVERLNDLILQLAIQGKLTEDWRANNPNVESASKLLEQIKAEKERLIKEKYIKKGKPLPPIEVDEIPFKLPKGWVWCRLSELVTFAKNFNIHKELKKDDLINYVDIASIDNKNYKIRDTIPKPVKDLSSRARRVLKKDDIVYSLVRPYLNNIAIVSENKDNYIGSTGFAVFSCILVSNKYIFEFLLSPFIRELYLGMLDGFNSPSISHSQFKNTLVPLPPLLEQDIIVNQIALIRKKVNSFVRLSAKKSKANVDIANSILHHFTKSNNKDEQRKYWSLIQNDFLEIFSNKQNIDSLRQTILQLAIQGKLTQSWRLQNPNVESAEILLLRIKAEKATLVKAKKIKKSKPLPSIAAEEIPFELPDGWVWCRVSEIAIHSLGKMLDRNKNKGNYKPYLRNLNVQWKKFQLSDLKKMKFEEHELGKYSVIKGDVLICEGGYPGRAAIWDKSYSIMFQKALHRVRFIENPVFATFFVNYLLLMDYNRSIERYFTGAGIQHLTGRSLAKIVGSLTIFANH